MVSSRSGTASPTYSTFSLSPEAVSTPATEKSVLFDDDVVADPLDIASADEPFIMIVGGLGYIGSHTVLELLKEGYNVLVIDDLSNLYVNVLSKIRTLAIKYGSAQGKPMPALHFRELDY